MIRIKIKSKLTPTNKEQEKHGIRIEWQDD